MMGADRTSEEMSGTAFPDRFRAGAAVGNVRKAQVACISETEPDKICVGFLEISAEISAVRCAVMDAKIGRGVSPLLPVLGNLRLKLSCALAALLAKCKQDITRTDNHYTNPKPS